jgi:DNA-binding MurR/RpiR family transcriptional regulator
MSANTVLAHIRSLLPSLAPAEQRVAAVALNDAQAAARMTISELAVAATTSETTVVRFCRAIGLRGYPELRIALASAAALVTEDAPVLGSDIGPEDALADVIAKVGFADSQAIVDTVAGLDRDVVEKVVSSLVAARRIELYGVGASAFVALDFQQKLHRIGRTVYAWVDPHIALTSAALLTGQDVAIGISHTGETADTILSLREARSRGAKTVAITNFPRSAIAQAADLVVTTSVRETTFRSGAMASRIAALTVVDCIFVATAQRDYMAVLAALERTRRAVTALNRRDGRRG